MLHYTKGPPPKCLTDWGATPQADWDSLHAADRDQVRHNLVRDQAALCAYCQRRIRPDDGMKIEHWDARSTGGDHFRWSNLLGVCDGRFPGNRQCPATCHCDTERGNTPLFLHPVRGQGPSPREFLRYTGSGQVTAEDDRAAADIRTLNLNALHLSRGRVAVLEALIDRLGRDGDWRPGALEAELRALELAPGSRAPEHAESLRHHLLRWLRKHRRP